MKYKIKKGLIFEKKGKKITIFDSEKSILITLNETASFILKKIIKGSTEAKLLEFMISNYKIEQKVAKMDLLEFLKELKKNTII